MFGKFFMAIPIAALALGSTTACATKKFVRTSVGEVNDKVDSLGKSLEETQERTRQNEGKITAVDQKADQAAQSAQQANVIVWAEHSLIAEWPAVGWMWRLMVATADASTGSGLSPSSVP